MGSTASLVGPALQVLVLAASVALQIALAPKGPDEIGARLGIPTKKEVEEFLAGQGQEA